MLRQAAPRRLNTPISRAWTDTGLAGIHHTHIVQCGIPCTIGLQMNKKTELKQLRLGLVGFIQASTS